MQFSMHNIKLAELIKNLACSKDAELKNKSQLSELEKEKLAAIRIISAVMNGILKKGIGKILFFTDLTPCEDGNGGIELRPVGLDGLLQ